MPRDTFREALGWGYNWIARVCELVAISLIYRPIVLLYCMMVGVLWALMTSIAIEGSGALEKHEKR